MRMSLLIASFVLFFLISCGDSPNNNVIGISSGESLPIEKKLNDSLFNPNNFNTIIGAKDIPAGGYGFLRVISILPNPSDGIEKYKLKYFLDGDLDLNYKTHSIVIQNSTNPSYLHFDGFPPSVKYQPEINGNILKSGIEYTVETDFDFISYPPDTFRLQAVFPQKDCTDIKRVFQEFIIKDSLKIDVWYNIN